MGYLIQVAVNEVTTLRIRAVAFEEFTAYFFGKNTSNRLTKSCF